MSHNSKRTAVSMITGVILIIFYIVYVIKAAVPPPDDLRSWAIVMLAFIGISFVVMIIIHILFYVIVTIGVTIKQKEHDDSEVKRIVESSMVEDEREKLIQLKSTYVGYIIAGIGFISSLVALALGLSMLLVLHIILASFLVGSIVEGGASIYYYEKGVHNG